MALSQSPGEIITFYSYKGGAGRSMALANVACLLAQQGHSVLAIDWDLEAPGLHRFLRPSIEWPNTQDGAFERMFDGQPGLIDIFAELSESVGHSDLQGVDSPSDMFERFVKGKIISTEIPKLDLLKAGRFDDYYAQRVNQFDWRKLFHQAPDLFSVFAECLTNHYEYVFIDSRTGITDMGGICTMLMPEKLVVVFTLNQQSLMGVLNFVRAALNYRGNSNDFRPLTIFPVPSRVETSEVELRYSYRFGNTKAGISGYQQLFEQLFREIYSDRYYDLGDYFDEVEIQYVPFYAYGEVLAVLGQERGDRLSLSASYKRFADILTRVRAPWEYRYISPTEV